MFINMNIYIYIKIYILRFLICWSTRVLQHTNSGYETQPDRPTDRPTDRPPGLLRVGPLWAPLGPYAPGPCGPPSALMGWDLVGPWALVG